MPQYGIYVLAPAGCSYASTDFNLSFADSAAASFNPPSCPDSITGPLAVQPSNAFTILLGQSSPSDPFQFKFQQTSGLIRMDTAAIGMCRPFLAITVDSPSSGSTFTSGGSLPVAVSVEDYVLTPLIATLTCAQGSAQAQGWSDAVFSVDSGVEFEGQCVVQVETGSGGYDPIAPITVSLINSSSTSSSMESISSTLSSRSSTESSTIESSVTITESSVTITDSIESSTTFTMMTTETSSSIGPSITSTETSSEASSDVSTTTITDTTTDTTTDTDTTTTDTTTDTDATNTDTTTDINTFTDTTTITDTTTFTDTTIFTTTSTFTDTATETTTDPATTTATATVTLIVDTIGMVFVAQKNLSYTVNFSPAPPEPLLVALRLYCPIPAITQVILTRTSATLQSFRIVELAVGPCSLTATPQDSSLPSSEAASVIVNQQLGLIGFDGNGWQGGTSVPLQIASPDEQQVSVLLQVDCAIRSYSQAMTTYSLESLSLPELLNGIGCRLWTPTVPQYYLPIQPVTVDIAMSVALQAQVIRQLNLGSWVI